MNFYNQNIEVNTIETDTSKMPSSKLRDVHNRMKPIKPAGRSPSRGATITLLVDAVGNSQTAETKSLQCYVHYRMTQTTSSGGNRMRKETARTGTVLCEGYCSGEYEIMSKTSVEYVSHIYIVDVRDLLIFFSKDAPFLKLAISRELNFTTVFINLLYTISSFPYCAHFVVMKFM